MGNNYFQFKEFRIEQDLCAMKVTTDACIQGAWTPILPNVARVLDVGIGTGLLCLMLAQRNKDILVDGIEFDKDAVVQAGDNINASPWKDRVCILEGDVRDYDFVHKYDLIISNPPFFNDSLLSDNDSKNLARHTLFLSYPDLLKVLEAHLLEDGYASIMLPFTEYQEWKELLAQNAWFELGSLSVSHTITAPVKRVVGIFSKNKIAAINAQKLAVCDNDNKYTAAFIDLLSQFYLNL